MYLQSHIYKNIPVSFDFITTWNQLVFLCSPCSFISCWPCISLQILANNQLDSLFHVFIYFISLHVSIITVLIIRRSNCINTSSGMISLCKWLLGTPVRRELQSPPDRHTKQSLTQTNHTTWCTRVGTLIMATIYLQLIQNRYMFRSFTVLQSSHQHCVQPVATDVEVVGYL